MTVPLHEATTAEILDELMRRCEYVVLIVGGSPDCERHALEARMSVRCADEDRQRVCDVVMASMADYAKDFGCRLSADESNGYEAGPFTEPP